MDSFVIWLSNFIKKLGSIFESWWCNFYFWISVGSSAFIQFINPFNVTLVQAMFFWRVSQNVAEFASHRLTGAILGERGLPVVHNAVGIVPVEETILGREHFFKSILVTCRESRHWFIKEIIFLDIKKILSRICTIQFFPRFKQDRLTWPIV